MFKYEGNNIIIDNTGEIYLKKGRTHTKTWHYRVTKEVEQNMTKEIKRVLGIGKKGGENVCSL